MFNTPLSHYIDLIDSTINRKQLACIKRMTFAALLPIYWDKYCRSLLMRGSDELTQYFPNKETGIRTELLHIKTG